MLAAGRLRHPLREARSAVIRLMPALLVLAASEDVAVVEMKKDGARPTELWDRAQHWAFRTSDTSPLFRSPFPEH